jgi:phage shock protein A
MGVFERMGRVISSNFNALVDSVEDPRKSIELTIKEMGDQVRAARQEVVKSVAAEKQLRKKVDELAAEVTRWETRAELAIKHGDDDLAREALRHRRRLAGERDRAEQLRVEQRAIALEMKADVERMDAKVKEVEARRGTLAAKAQQAKAGGGVESLGATGAAGRPFDEFRRMEAEIEGVEAAIEVQRELDEAMGPSRGPSGMTPDEVERKFRVLEAGGASPDGPADDVDEELAALKKRVRIET